jgi:hypothetical protein
VLTPTHAGRCSQNRLSLLDPPSPPCPQVGSEGIAQLSTLHQLQALGVGGLPMVDECCAALLPHLPRLQRLSLERSKRVGTATLAALKHVRGGRSTNPPLPLSAVTPFLVHGPSHCPACPLVP